MSAPRILPAFSPNSARATAPSSASGQRTGQAKKFYRSYVHGVQSFEFLAGPAANVPPLPVPMVSTRLSIIVSNHTLPSSLASHLEPRIYCSSSMATMSFWNAFLRPKTWLTTWGPVPVCARKQAIATRDVRTLPTNAGFSNDGESENRAPYALSMI